MHLDSFFSLLYPPPLFFLSTNLNNVWKVIKLTNQDLGLKATLAKYLVIYKKIIIKHLAEKFQTSAESEKKCRKNS